jgi:hypothetical protein
VLGTQREAGGKRLAMIEAVAVDMHGGLRCVTAVILCR